MGRLHRRGIGKFKLDRSMIRDDALRQSIDGLELAYEQLWADAERCIGDYENSWFWALMFRTSCGLMAPVVRDVTKMMDRALATAIMLWNGDKIAATEIGSRAYSDFESWFIEDFLKEHDKRCVETDEMLLAELNKYICSTMEREGVHPIELKYLSTDDYYKALRRQMLDELLPTVEQKMKDLVPAEIKDTRLPFLRRRRLCRGLDSFFALKKEQGTERGGFITDVLISEKLELDHANCLLRSLGVSIISEEMYLMSP